MQRQQQRQQGVLISSPRSVHYTTCDILKLPKGTRARQDKPAKQNKPGTKTLCQSTADTYVHMPSQRRSQAEHLSSHLSSHLRASQTVQLEPPGTSHQYNTSSDALTSPPAERAVKHYATQRRPSQTSSLLCRPWPCTTAACLMVYTTTQRAVYSPCCSQQQQRLRGRRS